MVGTRKTPSGRTTVTLDSSPVIEAVDNKDDTIDITNQFSLPRSSMPPYSDSIYTSPYQSSSVDLQTPISALTPSSYASTSKRPATPPLALNFDSVPNLPYFRGQWVYVGNLERLNPKLSPLGIILLGELSQFSTLKSAENNFNKDKPEFSLQLQVEEQSLEILKVLIRRRDRNLTVTNPLRVKVAEPDIASPFFTPRDPFPAAFDGTTTDDDQDGNDIDASRFTAGDKVAVQAWFGSYVFTNKSRKTVSGPTFRLLKL
ncbi:hypothetical protein V496_01337 [Pseudogymnoascus sp. VKM F-4515 (FW-2607)]|nr:hypothetical protein V496_01337 [Pseudogymnoascus sp. VKM F-4515 (FW-2607)]KFY95081.1 hypothetical protein V498_03528 [Pseudogymnoascus sp. VKM F-4517 (FW-2822)]